MAWWLRLHSSKAVIPLFAVSCDEFVRIFSLDRAVSHRRRKLPNLALKQLVLNGGCGKWIANEWLQLLEGTLPSKDGKKSGKEWWVSPYGNAILMNAIFVGMSEHAQLGTFSWQRKMAAPRPCEEEPPKRWFFTKEQLLNSPSRPDGVDPEKELAYRQQAAGLIKNMGDSLKV